MSELLNIVRSINEATRANYDATRSNHLQFLERCNQELATLFEKWLQDDYIFSALAYRSIEGNAFELVPVEKNPQTNYYYGSATPVELEKCIADLLTEAQREGKIISLTNALLKESAGRDLYFVNHPDDYREIRDQNSAINYFDLGSLAFDESPEIFFSNHSNQVADFRKLIPPMEGRDLSDFSKYLWHYRKMHKVYTEKKAGKSFYVHFIRPAIIEFDYNLLLALSTARKLHPEEIAFIDLVVYRIVAQTVRQKEKEEKETYILGVGHFMKHRTAPLASKLNSINADVMASNLSENNKEKFLQSRLRSNIVNATAHIIDILAQSVGGKKYFIHANLKGKEEKDVFEYTNCDLIALANMVIAEFDFTDIKIPACPPIEIRPYIFNKELETFIRPSNLFMQAILTEIIMNVSSWGAAGDNNEKEMRVTIDQTNGPNPKVIFSNALDKLRLVRLKTIINVYDQWVKLPPVGSRGGIFLLEKLIERSGMGQVRFRLSEKEMSFSISLNLNNHD